MSDIHHILPNFSTKSFTHIIPSLEKSQVTVNDLLTLDALEIANHAKIPILDVSRLRNQIIALLQGQLGLPVSHDLVTAHGDASQLGFGQLRKNGKEFLTDSKFIGTLDATLDRTLGGGIPTGYLTEITGESGAGKTQLLLSLLLSTQLPPPHGLSKSAIYISTEHALPTTRLSQLLNSHPVLSTLPTRPSLSKILTLQTPDLESQDHILTYQLPVAIKSHSIGLVVIDSIAANYRAEGSSTLDGSTTRGFKEDERARLLSDRSADLIRTGTLLRNLARKFNCAIVVANQVSDRFTSLPSNIPPTTGFSSPPSQHSQSSGAQRLFDQREEELSYPVDAALTLEHQQRWFTGWGDVPSREDDEDTKMKTPSLGLVWTNQIACRICLVKEVSYSRPLAQQPPRLTTTGPTIPPPSVSQTAREIHEGQATQTGEAEKRQEVAKQMVPPTIFSEESAEWTPRRWRRWAKLVFAPWAAAEMEGSKGVEFEVWEGGIRTVQNP